MRHSLFTSCSKVSGFALRIGHMTWKDSQLERSHVYLKARSHDPISRIRFLVPKIGSRRSDVLFQGTVFVVRMSEGHFSVCVHKIRFQNWQKNLQFGVKTITGISCKFVGAFHLSKRVSHENRACSIPSVFFRLTDSCVGRSFSMCWQDPIFETNKNLILKNGSCERAFMKKIYQLKADMLCCHVNQLNTKWTKISFSLPIYLFE